MAKAAVRRVLGAVKDNRSALTDRELLRRFATENDQSAFAALVRRHTGLVLGVCRRMLLGTADAEDATQAVFVVLARKAGVRWQPSVANWLYLTARKVSRDARRTAERRAKRERTAAVPEAVSPSDRVTGTELLAALDDELDRLPAIYREPLVLCYLDGLSREEAAVRLGVPPGTVKIRLERGRKKLADALTNRGVTAGLGLLTLAVTSSAGASPPRLIESILAAVGGPPSATVAALAQGVAVTGFLTKSKLTLLAIGVLVLGVGMAAVPTAAEPQTPAEKNAKPAAKADVKAEPPKADDKPKERTITGKVVGPDGKPVQAELMLVWQEGKPQPLGKTKDDGTFKVTVPSKRGEYGGWLLATAPGCGPDFQPHGIEYIPQSMTPTADVTLTLPKERPLKGRILDQQGKPVVGAAVVASGFSAFESAAAADSHLKKWATTFSSYMSAPWGTRHITMNSGSEMLSEPNAVVPSRFTATTDKEGRFEIAGTATGHLVALRVRAAGLADQQVAVVNRDGFDPEPINKVAKASEVKGLTVNQWVLHGSDPKVVLEPEKIIRGRVTDTNGNPRVGVRVAFTRLNKNALNPDANSAITDKDGRYEIRGARKHGGYMVEVPPEPLTGLLPCQGFADDTVGYEPITIDLKCAKGVVITGTVKNKATGLPVPTQMFISVLSDNPFVEKYHPIHHAGSMASPRFQTDADGRFRVVTIPGPVILMAWPLKGEMERFKPLVPDPNHPDRFNTRLYGSLGFYAYGGGVGLVQGCWCKVIEAKADDTQLTVDVELEPGPKTPVKVVDADGKPMTGCEATGVTHQDYSRPTECPTDTLTVFNLETKKERLLAVVHTKRKLVGTLTLTAETKDPVVKLGSGGTVTGRAVDADGKPLAGVSVRVFFERREATEAFNTLNATELVTTDANGEFRTDGLFPGQEFRLIFSKGNQRFGPDFQKLPKHKVEKHGDTLKLGDLKLEPSKDGE